MKKQTKRILCAALTATALVGFNSVAQAQATENQLLSAILSMLQSYIYPAASNTASYTYSTAVNTGNIAASTQNTATNTSSIAASSTATYVTLLNYILPEVTEIANSLNPNQSALNQNNAFRESLFAVFDQYEQGRNTNAQSIINNIYNTVDMTNSYTKSASIFKADSDLTNMNATIEALNSSDTLTGTPATNAQKFTNYLGGMAVPLTAPDPKWSTTPQEVQDYANLYRTMLAAQSVNINVMANHLAEKLPAGVQGSTNSAYGFSKYTNYMVILSQATQSALQSVPVLGWICNIEFNLTSLVVIAYKQLEALHNIENLLAASNVIAMENFSQTTGRQMYQSAQSAAAKQKSGQ